MRNIWLQRTWPLEFIFLQEDLFDKKSCVIKKGPYETRVDLSGLPELVDYFGIDASKEMMYILVAELEHYKLNIFNTNWSDRARRLRLTESEKKQILALIVEYRLA